MGDSVKAKSKQGNYSLRRPPKLVIPKAVIGQRWATVYRFMCNSIYKKQTGIHDQSKSNVLFKR